MAKKIHLICNAHLDPVWQWEWEEGAAEALSTFRIAADFCDEYDHFVFCHNEALLYQWIEEYDMPLFERIQNLVKQGKWHIMGGWQLQPDCNMPSGESFVRQILAGRRYFKEKFGVVPKVGVNVDPFGHSRGLVQIMKKSGYDGYLFMRPDSNCIGAIPGFPMENEFRWVGYDDSELTVVRLQKGYGTSKGKAADKVRQFIDLCPDDDFLICLWGIGNHGGGPSKKDLDDITALSKETTDAEIIHSTPEQYFELVNKYHTLAPVDISLNSWAAGCYTSQVKIKQKHRIAENLLIMTEIMCSQAESEGLMKYPAEEISQALYDIMFSQFHDALPGTSVQPVEECVLRMLDHGIEILTRVRARALFALSKGQKKFEENKIPILAYNPYPYEVSGDFACEFMLWSQIRDVEFLMPRVYDNSGKPVCSQPEKELSTIPIQWRKRVVFNATLAPMSVTRFDCAFENMDKKPVPQADKNDTHYLFDVCGKHIEINRKTGFVDVFSENGTNYIKENAFRVEVYKDNFDPWGMTQNKWAEKVGEFSLMTAEEAQEFCHTEMPLEPVHIIESGDVRTVIEAVFKYNKSAAVVKYTISQNESLKVDIRLVWNEKQLMAKLIVPASFAPDVYTGEHPYGCEVLQGGEVETVSQKYVTISNGKQSILAVNNGVYSSSFNETNGELKITLLRSPSYTAHPIGDMKVMPDDRYTPHIDQGERDFSFLFEMGEANHIQNTASRTAQLFNMQPMVISVYAGTDGKAPSPTINLTSNIINLTAFKKAEDGNGYIIRLFNPTDKPQTAELSFKENKISLSFGKYEIKTLRAYNGKIEETYLMENEY